MTFRKAVESKLPFRLKGEPDYIIVNADGSFSRLKIESTPVIITYADRLSDEWELLNGALKDEWELLNGALKDE